ncbi:phosphomannomutase/phosphoglucomutase [Granulosicoccus antarcticus]|uniref:phosphomannomutase n=1 Tax=Granulosicoccus antarcticus IMCC3135 TaxID=1192854 RepID=A0A2Z2NZB9_9GAMM|nr:phosphomannomutase/phosphoglucomutase [Granulosicoccus antarcticus]ASJ76633.1 Phosphomannomutase/phosphoglucomutase [Granulosicoccus antarcticus IMCC3135]
MNISSSIFRAYDIRGVVTDNLTPAAVEQIGRAFGSECVDRKIDTVVVARDGRLSGPALIEALSKGIQSTGVNVVNIGMVPTPVLYFATYHLNTGTGVMVTGSHNPPEYNGLKMVVDGEALFGDSITTLHTRLVTDNLHTSETNGKLSVQDILQDYLDRILGDVKLARPMSIAYDCGNGVAGAAAPQLFDGLNCKSSALFTEVDGNFPNHHPDPAKLENLVDLIQLVKDEKHEVGLAFDGDGDRVGVVDDKGNVIWPDRQMVLFARDVLERNPGARIVYDVKCSRVLPSAITEAGGVPDMWKTGHSFMKARIKETGALLGGEMSGHVFFKERWYGFDDALYAAARLLEILSKTDRSASEIFGAIPDSINTPELHVALKNDGDQHEFMAKFSAANQFEGATLTTIDGIRADYPDGWALVRASNTTPSLVIRFEAQTDEAMDRIQNEFRKAIQATDSSIAIPF